MACVSAVTACNVYPSAGARATAVVPMLPFAPARFSTTTGCPNCSRQLLGDDAGRRVDHAAGRPRNDDLQCAIRIFGVA